MYDLNLMSNSITNGVQVFFCFIFKISAWDSMGSMIFVWYLSGHLRCHDASFSLRNRRICFKISQVLKLFSAKYLSIYKAGNLWHALFASCHPVFFCWTTDQPPQKKQNMCSSNDFSRVGVTKVSNGKLWRPLIVSKGKAVEGIAASVHNAKFVASSINHWLI